MAQAGYTPIQLYLSTTASAVPSAGNLANGELAINITDGKLFYKDNGGVVQVLATKGAGTIGGSNTQVQYNSSGALAGSANLTFDGTTLTLGANPVLNGGTANGIPYLNGSKVLTSGSALTFDGTTSFAIRQNTGGTGNYSELALDITNSFSGSGKSYLRNISLNGGNSSTALAFGVNADGGGAPSEQMRLTSTGLSIGTSSVNYGLTLNKNGINTTAGWYQNAVLADASGNRGLFFGYDTSGNNVGVIGSNSTGPASSLQFWTFNGSTWGSRLNIDTSGNLGLGVTPSAWLSSQKALEVSGWSVNAASVTSSVATNAYVNSGSSWIYKATGYATRYDNVSGQHQWYTAPSGTAGNAISFTQAMTLDASGNLFVAQTGRTEQNSNSFSFDVLAKSAYVNHANGTSSGNGYIYFGYNAVNIGSITQNGTTGVLYNMVSDHRLKNNPTALNGSGEFIDALRPKTWDWWDGSGKGVGFIAHEFMEVAKYSGNGTKDAVDAEGKPVYQSIQPSSSEVMANLVAEIQSLRKRLAAAGI